MNSLLAIVAFAALISAVVGGLSDEQKATLRKNNEECKSRTGFTDEQVASLRKGNFSGEDSEQEYIFCMFRLSDLITEDGEFKKDVAMSKLPEDSDREKVEAAIDACMHQDGSSPANKAWLMAKCYHETYPEHGYV